MRPGDLILRRRARNTGPLRWPFAVGASALFVAGSAITAGAFFLPGAPLGAALLPLGAAFWAGAAPARAAAMMAFAIWPIGLCAWGLVGTGAPPLIMAPAAFLVVALGLIAGVIGLLPVTLFLTLIPVFPASPALPLAAMLPGTGLIGPAGAALLLAAIEATRCARIRRGGLALATGGLCVWAALHSGASPPGAPGSGAQWVERRVPPAFTERGGWIALRRALPDGATIVMGENLFDAEDAAARAFWCRAARVGNLTVLLGVAEPYGAARRGAVWRLDAETCAARPRADPALYRAGLGIPGLTGTWGPMRPAAHARAILPGATASAPDWLICLEAFLPWAWAGVLTGPARARIPVVVIANDSAFGPLPGLGAPPVGVLRRKVARAMAGLAGRPVYFADTGATYLIRQHPEARS